MDYLTLIHAKLHHLGCASTFCFSLLFSIFNISGQGQQAASTLLTLISLNISTFDLSTPHTKYIVSVLKAAINPQLTVCARPRLVVHEQPCSQSLCGQPRCMEGGACWAVWICCCHDNNPSDSCAAQKGVCSSARA